MHFLLLLSTLITLVLGAAIPDGAGPNAHPPSTSTAQGGAMVEYFEHRDFQGHMIYMISEEELGGYTESNAVCYYVVPNFLSSIHLKPRSDGRKYGCMLYKSNNCQGSNSDGSAIVLYEDTQRFTSSFNDQTNSLKCYME